MTRFVRGWLVHWLRTRPAVPLRRNAMLGRWRWLERLPEPIRRALELPIAADDRLRVEIGSGPYPTPGYLHVDAVRGHPHLEVVAPAWRLPFDDDSVDEILAVHVLEHVHPGHLNRTLAEWRRVLAPGGVAEIHVPDGRALARAYLDAPVGARWAIGAAFLGMDSGPEVRGPHDLRIDRNHPDHKAVLDAEMLTRELISAGFSDVVDCTSTTSDRHTEAWAPIVPRISLVIRATKPDGPP